MLMDKIIGSLMTAYRNSKFQNINNGKKLAKLLAVYNKFKKIKIIKQIDEIVYELDLSQVIDSSLYYSGTFEPKVEAIVGQFLKPGMSVMDIGANIGYHTFRMARLVKPDGIIYAIEPMSWALKKLKRNLRLNPHLDNIKIDQLAFSDISMGIQEFTFQTGYRLNHNDRSETEKIHILSLDDYMDRNMIVRLDFIKLDVDGLEEKIIRGAYKTIEKLHPFILFEFNSENLINSWSLPGTIFDFLKNNGYHLYNDNLEMLENYDALKLIADAGQPIMVFCAYSDEIAHQIRRYSHTREVKNAGQKHYINFVRMLEIIAYASIICTSRSHFNFVDSLINCWLSLP